MSIHTFLKAVGTGPKGNRDLTFDEARAVTEQMLNKTMTPEQIAAFLIGWRLKPESIDEFNGAIAACDALTQHSTLPDSLELGYPFDGKAKHPYLLVEVAKLCEAFTLPLIAYYDERVPAKDGVIVKEFLKEDTLPSNLHCFDRASYLPQLHQLTQIRQRLMLRTGFNTIEKLPRVANSETAITAVHHKPYVKKYIEMYAHRYRRFTLIQGNEGTPELFKNGTLWVVENGITQEFNIDVTTFGITPIKMSEALKCAQMQSIMQQDNANMKRLIALNAAIWLFAAGRFDTIDTAFHQTSTRI